MTSLTNLFGHAPADRPHPRLPGGKHDFDLSSVIAAVLFKRGKITGEEIRGIIGNGNEVSGEMAL